MILFRLILITLFIYSCVPYENEKKLKTNKDLINIEENNKNEFPFYYIGEPYFIDDVKYTPKENYDYNEKGRAVYFGKIHQGKKTINNEIINISELIASHKTLPLPSVVKVTNLENNISIILRVNNRTPIGNSEIISVSMQAAKLLGFYEKKFTNVEVVILPEESKQLMLVSQSINSDLNLDTITAAPTDEVIINNIE